MLEQFYLSKNLFKEIEEDCSTLFQLTDICYFDFSRIYKNGLCFPLWSNRDWAHHFIESNFSLPSFFCYQESNYVLWNSIKDLKVFDNQLSDAEKYFHIGHGLCIIQKFSNFMDVYNFGTHVKNYHMPNFYFKNLELLKKFLYYFQGIAEEKIKKINNLYQIPLRPKSNIITPFISPKNHFEFKVFKIEIEGKIISLSKQEITCLKYILRGFSLKKIAKDLDLSPRTVETYINRIKLKTNHYTISNLVNSFRKTSSIL